MGSSPAARPSRHVVPRKRRGEFASEGPGPADDADPAHRSSGPRSAPISPSSAFAKEACTDSSSEGWYIPARTSREPFELAAPGVLGPAAGPQHLVDGTDRRLRGPGLHAGEVQ